MDVNSIRDLEKKYQEIIWNILGGDFFESSLNDVQEIMRKDHEEIAQKFAKTNITETLFERITRYFIYRNKTLDFERPFHSPLSSDIAFETNDAIIFIDCKTVNMDDRPNKGNKQDYPSIVFNINQCTFDNENVYRNSAEYFNQKKLFNNFEGVVFPNNLTLSTSEGKFNNKPILTYILGLHYYPADPNPENYSITDSNFQKRQLYLACLPNFHTARQDFNNNLVTKFKFYEWVEKQGQFEKYPDYIPINSAKPNFKKFRFLIDNGPGERTTQGNYYYYDNSQRGPYNTKGTIWREKGGKYEVLLHGKTPRIRKTLFTENKNEKWRLSTNYFN